MVGHLPIRSSHAAGGMLPQRRRMDTTTAHGGALAWLFVSRTECAQDEARRPSTQFLCDETHLGTDGPREALGMVVPCDATHTPLVGDRSSMRGAGRQGRDSAQPRLRPTIASARGCAAASRSRTATCSSRRRRKRCTATSSPVHFASVLCGRHRRAHQLVGQRPSRTPSTCCCRAHETRLRHRGAPGMEAVERAAIGR